jgi:uncharacterized protein (TIGR02466 family)
MAQNPTGRIETLFGTPLFTFTHPDPSLMNLSVTNEAYAIKDASVGITRSNQNGWHSDPDLFRRAEPGIIEMRTFIVSCVSEAVRSMAAGADLNQYVLGFDGWININPRHGYNVPHDHPGNVWSGSYYVHVPEKVNPKSRSGEIEFLDPRNGCGMVGGGPVKFAVKHRLTPKAGQLIAFPSWLRHWVYPNEEPEDRISVAFNCKIMERKP